MGNKKDSTSQLGKLLGESRRRMYNRDHCNSTVRATIEFGNTTITLVGKHAFEWSIVKELQSQIIIMTFKNREQAREEFNKYKSFKNK